MVSFSLFPWLDRPSRRRYNLTGKIGRKGHYMGLVATTRMSSKGQVVIPEDVRRRLRLDTGAQFLVLGEDDVVILKRVKPPSMGDFDPLVKKARVQAKASGLTRSGVSAIVSRVRKRSGHEGRPRH
jgi:AbrB family looped-hinge helix DNA binding protein